MSRNKGTAEKSFRPAYAEGGDPATYQATQGKNMLVAMLGKFVDERYSRTNAVYGAWSTIQFCDACIRASTSKTKIMRLRRKKQKYERRILAYMGGVFKKHDGTDLRRLADVIERKTASPNAVHLIGYCGNKPPNHVFTAQELLQVQAQGQGFKPPYDEAIMKRFHRLIKNLGIRVRKRQ
jgi:hypothetical protein